MDIGQANVHECQEPRSEQDPLHLFAPSNLARNLSAPGKYVEAVRMVRENYRPMRSRAA